MTHEHKKQNSWKGDETTPSWCVFKLYETLKTYILNFEFFHNMTKFYFMDSMPKKFFIIYEPPIRTKYNKWYRQYKLKSP